MAETIAVWIVSRPPPPSVGPVTVVMRSELDLGGFLDCFALNLKQLGGEEAKHACKDHIREDFSLRVVGSYGIVESLAGE